MRPFNATNIDDFEKGLHFLTPEQCSAVCTNASEQLPDLIKSATDFARLLCALPPAQRDAARNNEAVLRHFPNIIKNADIDVIIAMLQNLHQATVQPE